VLAVLAQLGNSIQYQDLMALLVVSALLAAGLGLIVSSSGERAKTIMKRIDKVRRATTASEGVSLKRLPGGRVTPKTTERVSEAEYRQIIRIYSRFGVPAERALHYFDITRAILPAVLVLVALPFTMGLFARSTMAGLLVMAVPALIGWFLPMFLVRRSIARHSKAVSSGLPDALELLAVCVEAGLSLENGLQRVSAELRRSRPKLADELALTWAEINILPNRDQALLNLADRVNVDSVRSVVTTLSQTLRYGTPLARSLRVVSGDVRGDQLTALEEKANRLPALMTVPVMLFIMPTIFLIIGGPVALKLMDAFYH